MYDGSLRARFLLPMVSLWWREVLRFVRQRSRIVGALGTPLVFWLLLGAGMGDSFRQSGGSGAADYLEYSFPGMIVLVVLFTAVFATISVIEDRQAGFLQAVLASPVDRTAVVLGKILGCSTLALGQATVFLMLAPTSGVSLTIASAFGAFGVLAVISVGLSSLGLFVAWRMESTQGFHAVMNLFLIPMWILSGATFPASGASKWISWIISVNPVTYGVAALRRVLYPGVGDIDGGLPSLAVSIVITFLFAAIMLALTVRVVRKHG